MAKAEYLFQGINKDCNHMNKIIEVLKKKHDETIIYTAFLKKSSVDDIKEELEKKKGTVKAFVGIRNGITSSQGIKSLLDVGVDVYAIDTGSSIQIFHPKTLVAINRESFRADVIIGSANFTPGGFLRNMENSAFLELDLNEAHDGAFVDSFLDTTKYLLTNYSSDNVIHVVSDSVVTDLLLEGRVIDENAAPMISSVGTNKSGKPGISRMPIKIGKHRGATVKAGANTPKSVVVTNVISGGITEIWCSKELVERDLTIPSGSGTNPTGSMLMKKGAYDIDQQHYFRFDAFAGLSWGPKEGKAPYFEFATAKFHFMIDGIDNGAYDLTLKYDSRTDTRAYLQRQPNVHLSWGDAKDIIKNRNLLGQIMHLYKVDGEKNEFVIEIKEN